MDAAVGAARAAVSSGDMVVVGVAGAILVGAAVLQRSLGDVAAEEAMLPPSAGAKVKREAQRSKRFLNRNKPSKKK